MQSPGHKENVGAISYQTIIEHSPLPTVLFTGRDLVITDVNEGMLKVWNRDRSIIGMTLLQMLPEMESQPFIELLQNVWDTGKPFTASGIVAKLEKDGKLEERHFDISYSVLKDDDGNTVGVLAMGSDTTAANLSRLTIADSEERFRKIVEQSPMAIGMLKSRDLVIETGNDLIFEMWGKGKNIIGMPLADALPELRGQGFIEMLQSVYDTGEPVFGYDTLAKLLRKGNMADSYFDFAYTPVREAEDNVSGVMVLANEVTEKVRSKGELQKVQERFRLIVEMSPTPMCLLSGIDLEVELANKAMLHAWGKDNSVIGKPFIIALPEMEGQPFVSMLKQVYDTGITMAGNAVHAQHEHDGVLVDSYYDFSYSAVKDADGQPNGVLVISHDVTEQMLARRTMYKTQGLIDTAVETAKLGTWELILNDDKLTISDRVKDWFGFADIRLNWEDLFTNPAELAIAREKLNNARLPGANGVFDMEFRIEKEYDLLRYVRIRGQIVPDVDGHPLMLVGTIQDVTLQRNTEMALEAMVQERTEELASTNEELTASNEDLNQTNEQLTRSNEELTQYAYVASHDLQEPLRKIRMFSDMLMKQVASEKDKPLIGKITQSAQRMSVLIQDLLKFSRLLDSQELIQAIDLNEIVKDIVIDFELGIQQQDATIELGKLPTIDGVKLHMNQLFYNLMSNALKFTTPERKPVISVSCSEIDKEEAKELFALPKYADKYYCINFTDNGIGFNEEYQEKVFEIFKRLHTRDEYEGSGIGLALCRRIAANHGGHLSAHSVIDEGTTFYIYLPAS
ncbi:MAG: PAS domain-containing protein [Sphingobacteriales bacterium]|nr:MAG: PAS domain-containing protein [Sphingobacteriales bacterium]